MIQLTNVFCVLLRYNGTGIIWLQYAADSIIRDPIKQRALYTKNKTWVIGLKAVYLHLLNKDSTEHKSTWECAHNSGRSVP